MQLDRVTQNLFRLSIFSELMLSVRVRSAALRETQRPPRAESGWEFPSEPCSRARLSNVHTFLPVLLERLEAENAQLRGNKIARSNRRKGVRHSRRFPERHSWFQRF